MPLNDIATEQTTATDKIQTAASQLLDYLAMHPHATIRVYASDMILHIHRDASYLSVSKARSRLGGLFYLGHNPPNEDKLNGSILNVASFIKYVVASAAESEVGVCFQNAQTATAFQQQYRTQYADETARVEINPHKQMMIDLEYFTEGLKTDGFEVVVVNPSGKTGTQIPQLPLGDNSSPWGDNAVCT
jgi:hypothetical protein